MAERYTYLYPNQKSYAQLPVSRQHGDFHWQGRSLRHGYIYGYKSAAATPAPQVSTGSYVVDQAMASSQRQINYQSYKIFQFNPAALSMNATMMEVEDASVQASGGALPNNGVGLASSGLELFFDRTDEIARANTRLNAGSTYTDDALWRDIGVQQDLFDFFKVISGGETSKLGLYPDEMTEEGDSVRSGSLNRITGAMFDAAIAGSRILFTPFVVVFNPNLTIHVQRMTSFAFTYLRFTSDLVPTTVKLEIGLEITNMGTKSYVTQTNAPAATSTTTPPPGTLAIPAGMPPGTNMAVPV